jgi:tetrahydromethanopterin S-methyltransferase, F subunit
MGKKTEFQNRMMYLDQLTESISYRSQLIARSQKPDSGISATRLVGFAAGFLTAVTFVLLIPLIVWYVIGII